MDAFAQMMGALFADRNLAKDAAYAPPGGGSPIPCRAMATLPTGEMSFARTVVSAETAHFDVQASVVASPVAGGILTLDPGTPAQASYVIQGQPKLDSERLVWTLDTYPQGA